MTFLYNTLKKYRKYMLFLCDFVLWNIAFYISFVLWQDDFSLAGKEYLFFQNSLLLNLVFSVVFSSFKLYDKIWRYADIEDFFYVGVADLFSSLIYWCLSVAFIQDFGIGTYILFLLISTFLIFSLRIVYRFNILVDTKNVPSHGLIKMKKVLIIGAGETTATVLREMSKNPMNKYVPIGILDDDPEKLGRNILGVKIIGTTYEIATITRKIDARMILFSITKITPENRRRILDSCAKTRLEMKIVPNLYEMIRNEKSGITSGIRHVRIEDLLGRDPILLDKTDYGKYLVDKTILVTGGGGSIGSELCKQIARLSPKLLIILDIYENSAYEIQQKLIAKHGKKLNLKVVIASIRDSKKVDKIFAENTIDIVFHAAAHKHVPLMEDSPEEAVKNNVFGTINLVSAADKYGVKKFVQISTDKAVNPTNIMGATKRICEMLIQFMDKKSKTDFVAVRFGNVLGSNGSVIPLFEEQIRNHGPVTVTHPEIIRFFMTIREAVSLVLTAGSLATGGEIFVLDMGEPVKIRDLAENLIRLSGFVPNKDIKIEYTGLRPGEKLYEEILLNEEGIKKTQNEKIYVAKPIDFDSEKFVSDLKKLRDLSSDNRSDEVEKLLSEIVSTFNHKKN